MMGISGKCVRFEFALAFMVAVGFAVPTKAVAQDKVILAIGIGAPSLGYVVAVDSGAMKAAGVDAEYKVFPSGVEAVVAVGAGEAQVASGSCSTILRARANGSKLLIVGRVNLNSNEHKLIAQADIKSANDLKGKTLGYQLGSSTDWYASKYLASVGIAADGSPNGVKLLNIAAPEWIPALQRGDIQGFFGWDPWVTRAPGIVNGAHVLNNGGDNGLFVMMNCLVFNEDWVKAKPELAKATLKGLVAAHDDVEVNRQKAADLATRVMRIPAADLVTMSKAFSYSLEYTPEFLKHVKEAAAWAKEKGMLKDADPETLLKQSLDPDLLRSAVPAKFK